MDLDRSRAWARRARRGAAGSGRRRWRTDRDPRSTGVGGRV